MDVIIVAAIILGILVVLFVLDWRLNRNRPRPWRTAPPSQAEVNREQHPQQGDGIGPFLGGGGSS
jgi:hypothetical protein